MITSSSLISLASGMFILRHPGKGLAPLVLAQVPGNAGNLEFLATRGRGMQLCDGSDCIVVLVKDGAVEMLVTALGQQPGQELPVLRVDQIALDPVDAAVPFPVPAATPAPIEIGPHGISLIGHFEQNGDIVAAEGMALGIPADGLRLEGFQAVWPDKPAGVELFYGVAVEGEAPAAPVASGKFCGTRGKARRIVEVLFDLQGPHAAGYRLEGDAWFSGGFHMPVVPGMRLSGPSGAEHLAALRLRAVPAASAGRAASAWDPSARTTVFKKLPPASQAGKPATKGRKKQ